MPRESILGKMDSRVRTDVRLPKTLWSQVSKLCHEFGIPKNAFFTIAACSLLSKFSGLKTPKKGSFLLKEIQSILHSIEVKLS